MGSGLFRVALTRDVKQRTPLCPFDLQHVCDFQSADTYLFLRLLILLVRFGPAARASLDVDLSELSTHSEVGVIPMHECD